ncbi:MAG: acetate--CoA ligase family protein [Candidatus Aenigmatarchaeota archaeon]
MIPKRIFKKVLKDKRKNLLEHEAYQVLNFYKIATPKWFLAKSKQEAVNFAEKIGYPVVLKIVSKDIIHKSDVGGVFIDLLNKEAVAKAYDQIMKNVKENAPKAKIEGIIVYEMVQKGKEVIVGGLKDAQFGQIIMFGSGGVLVELLEDVSFRVLPITKKDAEEMFYETKVSRVLKGYRGKLLDVKAVINLILKTAKLLEDNPEIKELDINPVMVLEKGAYPVDARIILE